MRRTYTTTELLDRFVLKLPNNCWRWKGRKKQGYGVLTYKRQEWRAHRLLYTLLVGDIPEGVMLLHRCQCKDCVNPDHRYFGDASDAAALRELQGHTARGEKIGKLTVKQVLDIRERFHQGKERIASLARLFSVSPRTIRDVVYEANWRHVDTAERTE